MKRILVAMVRQIIGGLAGIFVLAMLIPIAQAEEPIDFTQYNTCTSTMVLTPKESKEFVFYGMECLGMTRSNLETKVFENMTVDLVAIGKVEAGQGTQHNLSKSADRDGDYVVMEFNETKSPGRPQEGTWKILYGSGKWKGIKGSGKHVHLNEATIKPGTLVAISRNTGTFEVPK